MQKRKRRGRLGEDLIAAGHLSSRDLERALDIQRVAGGHLGTNLLELGLVDEDVLLEAVGRLHENPTVPAHRLKAIPNEVSSKVPPELVRRHSIVPFAMHGNTVYIASQRPGDIHIENEVTLATSRLTRTFVGLEVRIQQALNRYHGHSLPLRFSRLVSKLDGEPSTTPVVDPAAMVQSQARVEVDSDAARSEWISGPARPSHSSTSSALNELGVGQPSGSDRFDPTLADTVGHRIVWKDFETDEIEEVSARDPSASRSNNPMSEANPARAALDAATASAPPLSIDSDSKDAIEVAAESNQTPIGTRQPRKNKPRASFSLSVSGMTGESSGATVESEVLGNVSSPDATDDTLHKAHAALLEAANREAVGRILMQAFRPYFKRRILLAKRGGRLHGWRADGPGVQPRLLSNLNFLVSEGTPFLAITNGSRFWLSAYKQDTGFDQLAAVLGPTEAPDCMILPLRAGQHIIGFLYGDNEEDTVTGQPLQHFLDLSDAAGVAFESIIRRLRETKANRDAAPSKGQPVSELDPWEDTTGSHRAQPGRPN